MKKLANSNSQKGLRKPELMSILPGVFEPNAAYPAHAFNMKNIVIVNIPIMFALFITLFSGGDDFKLSCISTAI